VINDGQQTSPWLTATSWTIGPLADGQYAWQVRARNAAGTGPNSVLWTLRVNTSATPTPTATRTPTPTPAPVAGRFLYRGAALADGTGPQLQRDVSILVADGRIAWIRPAGGEEDSSGAELIDASGSTIVPGMVDGHAHVTLEGGARWLEHRADPPASQVAAAERNARLLRSAGVRWIRDVGSVVAEDPVDGRIRGLALGIRDRWAGQPGYPHIRAAGGWVTRGGSLPTGLAVEAANADELVAAAVRQIDDGADLVKLYLDGPDPVTPPWSGSEVRRAVDAVHERGVIVTAHSGTVASARVAVEGGVDVMEHGFQLDADVARRMAAAEMRLVSTLTVLRSWLSFAQTTTLELFASQGSAQHHAAVLESAEASVRLARDAGVVIAAGTDFGGGSLRANQLAWEVEALVAAGLEPWEALGAATWRGGELLGEDGVGEIREGGPADFFLVHGDPLSEPRALWRVWRVAWAG
jgi:imidazolonepropionase-like amidohydrolase